MKEQEFIKNELNLEDDQCDIYTEKVCDNCGKCLGLDGSDYKVVRIDGILNGDAENEDFGIDLEEYMLEETTLDKVEETEEGDGFHMDYIEDIPELKKEYDRKIDDLLGRK